MAALMGASLHDESIPLADDDPQVLIGEEEGALRRGRSSDSMPSSCSCSHSRSCSCSRSSPTRALDADLNADEQEEKARLITQVLELQNTLDDLSQRVDSVKEENLKLKSENQVLAQYIDNLMSASSVFQSTSPNVHKKK